MPDEGPRLGKAPDKPEGANWAKPLQMIDKVTYRADGAGYLKPGFDKIFMVDSDGGAPRQLTYGAYFDGAPEWTADGRLFVFNTNSSGGHQPWHWFTYVYSTRTNEFYSLDSTVGAITSDFELRGDTLVTTRLAPEGGKEMPLTIRLARWR